MATNISICSAALQLLGDAPIAMLEEGTRRAQLCASLYPQARADVMRLHPWNCCIKRVMLSPMTAEPAFSWRYQFPKPGDWLRTLQVGEDGCMLDYQFEGGRILANAGSLPFVYVADVPESAWDALLVDVMTRRMAQDLAYPITKSASLRDAMRQEYQLALKRAKSVDGQENPPEEWNDSPFISVRGGGYGYGHSGRGV